MITLGELISEKQTGYPNCDKEGLVRNYDIYRGMTVNADEVEKTLSRLYEFIDRLTSAYDEADK